MSVVVAGGLAQLALNKNKIVMAASHAGVEAFGVFMDSLLFHHPRRIHKSTERRNRWGGETSPPENLTGSSYKLCSPRERADVLEPIIRPERDDLVVREFRRLPIIPHGPGCQAVEVDQCFRIRHSRVRHITRGEARWLIGTNRINRRAVHPGSHRKGTQQSVSIVGLRFT